VDAILPEDDVVGTPEEPYVEKNKTWFDNRPTAEIEAARMTASS
jgi:hypothetical protein